MSRRQKNIEVEIVASSKDSEEQADLDVIINGDTVGHISQNEKNFMAEYFKENNRKAAKSIEEAVQFIVMQYNLFN